MEFVEKVFGALPLMTAPNIPVPHGFTTRFGGVSGGIWASLNLGENRGDEPERVLENYRRLKLALGVEKLVFSRQVHGVSVRRVTSRDAREPFEPLPYEADGLITDEEGLSLIVFTADCIPILFYDPVRSAIGAAHAGWRGTVGDIAGITIRKMASEFGSDPKDIQVAIGPGISRCCFETGPEVPETVRGVLGEAAEEFVVPSENAGKSMVDLKGVNRALLLRAGVPAENIAVSEECTLCLHEKYWSHRYTKGERGSQGAVIRLAREKERRE